MPSAIEILRRRARAQQAAEPQSDGILPVWRELIAYVGLREAFEQRTAAIALPQWQAEVVAFNEMIPELVARGRELPPPPGPLLVALIKVMRDVPRRPA